MSRMKRFASAAEALSVFHVDITTGEVRWKAPLPNCQFLKGKIAGSAVCARPPKLYWIIGYSGAVYKRSALVFLVAYGRQPAELIDHKDGDSLNDAAFNLREATALHNAWNRKSTTKASPLPMGVRELNGRYNARIQVNRKQVSLGVFNTVDEANAAYMSARRLHFGDFA